MKEFMNTMSMYLEHPFVRYALVVGVLIALCSSLNFGAEKIFFYRRRSFSCCLWSDDYSDGDESQQ